MTNTRATKASWLLPSQAIPPKGTKINLLTAWNVACQGHWDELSCVAWSPLLTTTKEIRQAMLDKQKQIREKWSINEVAKENS